jgi:hypothetical protein
MFYFKNSTFWKSAAKQPFYTERNMEKYSKPTHFLYGTKYVKVLFCCTFPKSA